ncbi:hypothetical protein GCM10010182_67040 [Actinomadura cremea]|nr:hypothetical protein GCM10010182_67040 [Actinomadura cremea]
MPLRWAGERTRRPFFSGWLFERGRHWLAVGLALSLCVSLLQTLAWVAPSPARADEPASDPTTASRSAATEEKASDLAVKTGDRVEVLSKRGEHRTVEALPDGKFEVTEHLRPVRARVDGEWKPIDLDLAPVDGRLEPGASTTGLRFSNGGDEPLVAMERAGRTISFSWPSKLPAPVVSGDVAEYRGVLGGDVDLQVKALPDGFTHTLVVKTAEAAADPRLAELAFGLESTRLKISQNEAGVLTAADTGSGSAVFEAPQPIMWDSSGEPAPAAKQQAGARSSAADGPADGAKTAPLDVEVTGGTLTLRPDQQMLTAPDTTFPVFIDPVWTTSKASSWAMVSSGWPDQSYYKFNGTEGVGRCLVADDSRCVKDQTKRLFYRMPLPSLKGRYVEKVEFVAWETSAYDCKSPTSVQLWRTSALVSHADWNNTVGTWGNGGAWGEHVASRDVAYCSSTPVEFSSPLLRDHVQVGLDKGYGSMTFGLKAYSESSMAWWKRFADDAHLKIQYNHPPQQPDTDTMRANPGGQCVDKPGAQTVNAIPTVYAYLHDKDTEDARKVSAQFTLHWADKADGSDWGEKWKSTLQGPLTSGSQFQMKLPSTIPQKKLIGWGVRAWDGAQFGPWSYAGAQTGCYFYYDTSVPGEPTISSSDYPGDGIGRGGVGETGRFVIADAKGVASKYKVTLNETLVKEVATTNGAPQVVELAPTRVGANTVSVEAFAPSHQNGPSRSYEFHANTGADPVARFPMDEAAGTTEVTAAGPGRPAWLRGRATLGAAGKNGTALELNGESAYAESPTPAVDTTSSFTVAAWAKPTRYGMENILAQNAAFQSAFQLGIAPEGKPVFKKPSTDTKDGGGGQWQQAIDDVPLPIGEWSHLIGVYDKTAQQLRLYVNGHLEATTNGVTAPLESHGALQIGRSLYNGTYPNAWPGSIDDVQAFGQALTTEQAAQIHTGTVPKDAGLVAHWNMNEAVGQPRAYSTVAPWKAALHNGATLGAQGRTGTALQLDNATKQYAATERPVINTLESFAVSAWLKVDPSATSPSKNFTAVSILGEVKSGFYLKYVEPIDDKPARWVFARTAHDSTEAGWFQATSKDPALAGEWTHLVGVYDAVTQKLKIYVNGERGVDSPVVTSRWMATGGLEIGRSQWDSKDHDHWSGLIDDVRVYDRVIATDEIGKMTTQDPVLQARWTLNEQPVNGKVDGLPTGAPQLTLSAGATINDEAGDLPPEGGLLLNPQLGGFAETAAPVVRTDDSFTITGWVRNQGRPQNVATVFSQAGTNANALIVKYVPGEDPTLQGHWQVEMRNGDDPAPDPLIAAHSVFTDHWWDHVAVVYDALNNEVSLYVNGELEGIVDGISQEGGVFGFHATNGGLQIGRNKFAAAESWPDAIDDVQVYSTALNEAQVLAVMNDPEPEGSP